MSLPRGAAARAVFRPYASALTFLTIDLLTKLVEHNGQST